LIVKQTERFAKELSRLPAEYRQHIEHFIFEELPIYNNLSEVHKAEKLQGYEHYYKIRFGSYRLGIYYENDVLILERALHRKDIYKNYP